MARTEEGPSPVVVSTFAATGVVIGVVVAVLTSDVILGVIAGASFIATVTWLVRLWFGSATRHPRHP